MRVRTPLGRGETKKTIGYHRAGHLGGAGRQDGGQDHVGAKRQLRRNVRRLGYAVEDEMRVCWRRLEARQAETEARQAGTRGAATGDTRRGNRGYETRQAETRGGRTPPRLTLASVGNCIHMLRARGCPLAALSAISSVGRHGKRGAPAISGWACSNVEKVIVPVVPLR